MKFKSVQVKNFGKLRERDLKFNAGLNIIYGENETGKTTLHTFLKGMLFGLKRKRGLASKTDDFSRYKPWEMGNYYAGSLKLEHEKMTYVINRSFSEGEKETRFYCLEDGKELDVESDLPRILEGLTEETYDNTISIKQLSARTDESLAAYFNDYATGYYLSGGRDIHYEAAFHYLAEKGKQEDKEIRVAVEKRRKQKEAIEAEMTYVWRDVHQLEEEKEALAESLKLAKKEEDNYIQKTHKWRIHPVEIVIFIAAIISLFIFIPRPWNYFISVLALLLSIIYTWNRLKVGKAEPKSEPEKVLEEIAGKKEALSYQELMWKRGRIQEELQDKKQQYYNLKERLEEFAEISELRLRQERKKEAVKLAMERLSTLSEEIRVKLEGSLSQRISEILGKITNDKYTRISVDEKMQIFIYSQDMRIPIEQLSKGTIEQVYFSLRVAITEIMFGEGYPLLLDDTFVYYDDERLSSVLAYLAERKGQTLLFTCHKREGRLAEELGIDVNEIKM